MKIEIKPSNQACGAEVIGVDLTKPFEEPVIKQIREWWLEYHVLSFPNQDINDDDLERFTLYFGPFGDDPFIAPIQGRSNICLLYTSPSPRDKRQSRMPSSA